MIAFLLTATALASMDPACEEIAAEGPPEGYTEQGQWDFLLNYFSLVTTFSPLHSAVPGEPGHASVGVELSVIPPLGCRRRLVLDYTKTEDTNSFPVIPRPRVVFTLPQVGSITPYAGLGYVPPVPMFGATTVIVSTEVGAGSELQSGLQLGGRFHGTLMKSVAEFASAFEEGGEVFEDFLMTSTFGLDLMAGYATDNLTPYLALGLTDVSTFFYVGDDGVVANNSTPYAGPVASVGAQSMVGPFDVAGELYTAPGYLYTGRLRAGLAF
ncbi:MAG: hypothetical protein QGG40_16620 [Myxococcota bacterium]|jgi:hypothetical protein|nr:hypothetical protein [Myxococcota bacterium]